MAEDTYSDFKEEANVLGVSQRVHVRTSEPDKIFRQRVRIRIREHAPLDYSTFKAELESAVAIITSELRTQHVQTRTEAEATRRDVLAAIKESPAEYLKLTSEFVALFLLFSLALRFAFKIELVNTAFAVFMLVAFAVYWCMALVKQNAEKRKVAGSQ